MRTILLPPVLVLATFAGLGLGCSSEPDVATTDPGEPGTFSIVVSPWEIDSHADYACYAVSVTSASGALVWSDDSICTDTFSLGATGTLGYIGICDAGAGTSVNTLRIALTHLVADDGSELGNWGDRPPTFVDEFICNRNQDTVVRAAFVVLTQGTKGFLDVSVQVDEIACNAKIDCRDDFLTTGPGPQGTIVLALTCDASHLFMDDVTLVCLDAQERPTTVTLDPSAGPGFHPGYPQSFVFGAMTSYGVTSDGLSSFWTLTLGVDPGWHGCRFSARMTASNGNFGNADDYPMIVARDVQLGFDAAGGFACSYPLDGDDGGIVTDWDDDPGYDHCLRPDPSMPDVTDVIVDDCIPGPCEPGLTDVDGDGLCVPVRGCTRSQDYWQFHCEYAEHAAQVIDWPAPEDEMTLVCGIPWLTVVNTHSGGTWLVLGHEWITARLNIANGASAPDAVVAAVAQAELVLTTRCDGVPMSERAAAFELAAVLNDYNTGVTGPGMCP